MSNWNPKVVKNPECAHEWKAVPVMADLEGTKIQAYRDECTKCGAIAEMDFKSGQRNAKPLAKVLDLGHFRNTKEIIEKVTK